MNSDANLPNEQNGDDEVSNEQHIVDEVASTEHFNVREPLKPLREITSNDCSTPGANADPDRQARINKTKRRLTEKYGWKFNVPPPPAVEDRPDGLADRMNGMADNRDSEESERATNASDPKKAVPCPQDSGSEKVGHKIVIDKIADFLRRFVFLQDETYYRLIAAWIVATHLLKKFEYLGYLFVYSPERRSGKTTLLEILNMLVYEPTGLQISPTEAVMFRIAEGHTHLLDEVDSWKNKDDLKDVLNAGYKKGGVVTRCDKGKAGFKPTAFSVFAPRALAGIGLSILHSTTLDRTFAVPMVRRKKEEKRERSRERVIGPQAKALKQEIERWVKEHEKAVAEIYDRAKFPYLELFTDRTIDIAEPLAAIVEIAYKGTPEAAQAQQDLVSAIASTRKEQQSVSNDHILLKHLLSLTNDEGPLVGNATELAGQCANLETPIDPPTVSRVLRKYGFKTKSIRKDSGEKPAYRYSLSQAELKEVVDRWTSDLEPASAETPDEPPLGNGAVTGNTPA